jgi:hypothetical protein
MMTAGRVSAYRSMQREESVAQIIAKSKDDSAIVEVCGWADALDAENLSVSDPDADGWSTVTFYGLPETDARFKDFFAYLQQKRDDGSCPWMPVDPASRDLSRIQVVDVEGLWRANFESLPEIVFFHESAARAAEHLCDDFGIAMNRLLPADGPSETHLTILVLPEGSADCPGPTRRGGSFRCGKNAGRRRPRRQGGRRCAPVIGKGGFCPDDYENHRPNRRSGWTSSQGNANHRGGAPGAPETGAEAGAENGVEAVRRTLSHRHIGR